MSSRGCCDRIDCRAAIIVEPVAIPSSVTMTDRPPTAAGFLAARKSALRRVLDTFFDGSMEHALAAHLTEVSSELKPDELKRLGALINKARKSGTES